jgi:hypothetical protein
MAVRMLADDKIKFTILTSSPVDPSAPTASELNAGIDASLKISKDGFKWSASDSDKIAEPALGSATNAAVPGMGNYDLGFTVWRQFDSVAGGFDAVGDAVFNAVKTKNTNLWCYARKTDKLASAVWATSDEIMLGANVVTDTPKTSNVTGYIRYEIPLMCQTAYPFVSVGGSAGAPIVASALPTAQTAGKSLLVKGVRFTGTTAVTVGGVAATNFTVIDDVTLTLTMPAGSAGSAPIIVTNASGAGASFPYTRA